MKKLKIVSNMKHNCWLKLRIYRTEPKGTNWGTCQLKQELNCYVSCRKIIRGQTNFHVPFPYFWKHVVDLSKQAENFYTRRYNQM